MHTTSAMGSAAADFAALLEAVALDPEALLGKVALSQDRSKGRMRPVQLQMRQRTGTATAQVESLASQANHREISPMFPASTHGSAETTLPEVHPRRKAQKSNGSSESLSPPRNAERGLSVEADLPDNRTTRKASSNRPAVRASRMAKVESVKVESTIGRSPGASRVIRSLESAPDIHTRGDQAQQIAVVPKQIRRLNSGQAAGSKMQRRDNKDTEIRKDVGGAANAKTDRKPPRSLRLRANVTDQWHAMVDADVPDISGAEMLPSALAETLLADDTVAIGHPGFLSEAVPPIPVSESEPLQRSQYAEPVPIARSRTHARRKCVTISVRLNEAEAGILRRRANESELSVSDYLRSCVLEADQLRMQVKQVLAEMRTRAQETAAQKESLPAADVPAQPAVPEPRWKRWLSAMRSPVHAVTVEATHS